MYLSFSIIISVPWMKSYMQYMSITLLLSEGVVTHKGTDTLPEVFPVNLKFTNDSSHLSK